MPPAAPTPARAGDEGILTCTAVLGGMPARPQALAALLVDLAIRGHLVITAETPTRFRVQPKQCPQRLAPEEILVKELISAASPAPGTAPTVTQLRDSRAFVSGLRSVMGTVTQRHLTSHGRERGYYHVDPGRESAGSGALVRMAAGAGGLAILVVGWPAPAAVVGGGIALLGAAFAPGTGPLTSRGRALLSGLDEIDQRLLDLVPTAAGGAMEASPYEAALPVGILLGQSLDGWIRVADIAYPRGCPWLVWAPPAPPSAEGEAPEAPGVPGPDAPDAADPAPAGMVVDREWATALAESRAGRGPGDGVPGAAPSGAAGDGAGGVDTRAAAEARAAIARRSAENQRRRQDGAPHLTEQPVRAAAPAPAPAAPAPAGPAPAPADLVRAFCAQVTEIGTKLRAE